MAEIKKESKEAIVKSQAEYEGNSHFDLVKVTILKDGDYYKEGDVDEVHPTLAAILKAKGLIGDYEKNIKSRKTDAIITDVESLKINEGDLNIDGSKIK